MISLRDWILCAVLLAEPQFTCCGTLQSRPLYLTSCSSMVATRACHSFEYPLGAKVSPRLLAHSLDTPHFPSRSHAFAHCLFLLTAVGWPCLVSETAVVRSMRQSGTCAVTLLAGPDTLLSVYTFLLLRTYPACY